MNYQLVLQFPESFFSDLDGIYEMEEKIEQALIHADLDGHDVGAGEVNFFILTSNPEACFKRLESLVLAENSLIDQCKAAYRNIHEEKFICLWPKDLTHFNVC